MLCYHLGIGGFPEILGFIHSKYNSDNKQRDEFGLGFGLKKNN